MTGPAGERDLTALFDPSSIAVVGASSEERKWGHWLAKGALRGAHRRRVALVNRRGGTILAQEAYRSIGEVPGGAELAVICVPAAAFHASVAEALECGAKAIVGITAGLGESGANGRLVEKAVAAEVRAAGAVLLGPNCLGLSDVTTELHLTSDELPVGTVALISQSGNLALELGLKAAATGLGFVRFVSLGNQADIDVGDLVTAFTTAPDVAAVAIYCEDFAHGRRFLEAAAGATNSRKPVVLLAAGASGAGARAARSHTGALVSGRLAIDAACRAAGIERVDTPAQMIEVLAVALGGSSLAAAAGASGAQQVGAPAPGAAKLVSPAPLVAGAVQEGRPAPPLAGAVQETPPAPPAAGAVQETPPAPPAAGSLAPPSGFRVGVLADGGGHGAVAADLVDAAGLAVPHFSAELAADLRRLTGTPGATANPVDLAGAGEQDPWSFAHVLERMLSSSEVDAVIVTGYFGGYSYYGSDLGRAEAEVADALVAVTRDRGKPVVMHAMHDATPAPEPIARLRAGRLPIFSRIEDAVAILARIGARRSVGPPALPEVLPPAAPYSGSGYFGARSLLAAAGIVFPPAVEAHDAPEAVEAARTIGYPVVLKAVSLDHKSDAGGVALSLDSDEAVAAAARSIARRVGPGPLALEKMITLAGGVELVVGAKRDPRFGAVVLVGLGGIYTEVLGDVAAALAPVGQSEALRLLSSLRGAPLLFGARGRAPLDVAAAATAVVAISRVASSHPEIAEVEVNPLLVGLHGAVGLDASVVLGDPAEAAEP